ncbi:MAG: hypothetical protein IJQ04_04830 [Prevotella sp.]|nr:hypothetical protein [Prevotella sp.]
MDINSRINWMPGMELTAETFSGIADHWDFRQRIAIRTALGGNHMGLVPGAPFSCNGTFVKNRFEVSGLQCMALLPSGKIVNADEDIQVSIPMLFGDKYYLTIGISEDKTEFEKKGVPFVRPRYSYGINTIEEIEAGDLFPLVRFKAADGVFSVDTDFIPPCLLLEDDPRFKEYIDRYTFLMNIVATHPNLAEGEGKRAMLRYVFMLKSYRLQNTMQDFILLTQEIAQAIDYYIVAPNKQPLDIPVPQHADIQAWLGWLEDSMSGAAVILDGVVLEDNTIDYEALLAQAKAELYERLHPELIEKVLADMKAELQEEMRQQTEQLTTYINENLKTAIIEQLTTEFNDRADKLTEMLTDKFDEMGRQLNESLYEKLYFNLFENLFNALYVPEPEELKFVPQI